MFNDVFSMNAEVDLLKNMERKALVYLYSDN